VAYSATGDFDQYLSGLIPVHQDDSEGVPGVVICQVSILLGFAIFSLLYFNLKNDYAIQSSVRLF